ncbi:Cna B-type domain-containing protein [Furfurilactobacillus rossiae]
MKIIKQLLMVMAFALIFMSGLGHVIGLKTADAATVAVSGLQASDAVITDTSGNVVSSDTKLDKYTGYKVVYNWKVADGTSISEGDTATFTLPSTVATSVDQTFDLTDAKNTVVGQGKISAGSSTGTITFSAKMASMLYDRKGTIYLTANGTQTNNNPTSSWFINKIGWINNGSLNSNHEPTTLTWNVAVNSNKTSLHNLVLSDELGAGQTFVAGSVVANTGSYDSKGTFVSTGTATPTVAVDGSHISFSFGDIDQTINMTYRVQVTNVDQSAGNSWTNSVSSSTSDGPGDNATSRGQVNWGSGGTVNGYTGSASLVKTDQTTNAVLPGAHFKLVDASGNTISADTTTDANGKLTVNNLKNGHYQFVETTAPTGYLLNKTPIDVVVGGANSTGLASAKDSKISETEITGTKKWVDNNNSDGKRPTQVVVELYRNGTKVDTRQVSEASKWAYAFTNLPTTDALGNKFEYSLKEESVAGYTSTLNGTDFVNTLIPNTPTTPNTPVTPSTPTAPNAPVTPNTPTTPNAPVTPSTPTTPNAPVTPSTPTTPNAPETPNTPTTPNTPVTPTTPNASVKPSIPVTPSLPRTSSVPNQTQSSETTSRTAVRSHRQAMADKKDKHLPRTGEILTSPITLVGLALLIAVSVLCAFELKHVHKKRN